MNPRTPPLPHTEPATINNVVLPMLGAELRQGHQAASGRAACRRSPDAASLEPVNSEPSDHRMPNDLTPKPGECLDQPIEQHKHRTRIAIRRCPGHPNRRF
jgi:hypothetical protein